MHCINDYIAEFAATLQNKRNFVFGHPERKVALLSLVKMQEGTGTDTD